MKGRFSNHQPPSTNPPSGLRPLPLIVLPLQHPPGDEAVHRLAGAEPHVAHPGIAPEHAPFHRRQRLAAVHALVLEQVAQVLSEQQPHPARARMAAAGELEVDQRRAAVLEHQPVGLLGQVVVGDAAPVQLLQQAARAAEIRQVAARRALVHRRALHVAAVEPASVPAQQLRHVGHPGDRLQRQRLAPGQPPGRKTQPGGHVHQVAAHEFAVGAAHQRDAAEAVGLQCAGFDGGVRFHGRSVGERSGGGCHNRQMESGWFDATLAWISAHPVAAGGLIFLIAFCDAIVVLGILVPALPLLFAIGALIGLGHIDGPYAVTCAAAGAFIGDGIGYWVGRRWGPQLREHWPFRRYPQLLDRGEQVFRRHGTTGILIARFVGAIRAFVPAIAGMLRMPLRRYVPMSLLACFLWAGLFLAPGWIFGASYDAVAAVADRLVLVLGGLLLVLALAWAGVLYGYRWFDRHANALLARALLWTRSHPRLGRYAAALIDPRRPESASLAILAACLLAIGGAWFALLVTVWMRGEPLALDLSLFGLMYELRNPLADRLMAGLASIGDWEVLLPAASLALAWLLWRRRWIAAVHWVAALTFGLVLTTGLSRLVDMPLPPTAPSGFGFPSVSVTMSTIAFGFFAVLIARELPGRSRVWPYMVSGLVVALLGFARLYLGAHWLSDVVGGMLLGIVWLLVLGIAYRRHVARSFWMRPLAAVFYLSFAVAALWHAPRAVDPLL